MASLCADAPLTVACGVSLAASLTARRTTRRRTTGKSIVVRFDDQPNGDTPTSRRATLSIDSPRAESPTASDSDPFSFRDFLSPKVELALPLSPRSRKAPSLAELGRLFDTLDMGTGRVGLGKVTEAAFEISDKYSLGIESGDIDRLMKFLQEYEAEHYKGEVEGTEEFVHREAFVKGLRGLTVVLAQVAKYNLSASQIRTVVRAAFKHFDLNNDGVISQQELAGAAAMLGMQLSESDVEILHRFIAPSADKPLERDHTPIWDKIASAFQATVHQTQKRYAVHSVDTIISRMSKAPQPPKTLDQQFGWLQQEVCEVAEHWAAALELAVSAAGLTVAAQYVDTLMDGAHDLAAADPARAAPFLTFIALGAMDFAKELDESVLQDMTVDEAFLYAAAFKDQGISQVQFRQLLALKSCKWTTSQEGDVLNGDAAGNTLRFVVRGRAKATGGSESSVKVHPGTVIGATRVLHPERSSDPLKMVAEEPVVMVSWDADEIRELLAHNGELSVLMDKVLAHGMSRKLRMVKTLQEKARKRSAAPLLMADMSTAAADRLQIQLEEEADQGVEIKKVPSNERRRSDDFIEEVRWLKLQLLQLRRRVNNPLGTDFSPVVDAALHWLDMVSEEFRCDVERRGLLRTWYAVKQVVDGMQSPKSFKEGMTQAFSFWHSVDEMWNLSQVFSDYTGAFLLVYGAWHHLSTLNGCSPDDFDASQFLELVAIWGTRASGAVFKKNVADLEEQEASLYEVGAFEEAGLTAGEFSHLFRGGAAKTVTLQPGEVMTVGLTDPALHMVIEGECEIHGNSYAADTKLKAREFLGQDALGVQDPLLTCPRQQCRLKATEETTILMWDMAHLQSELSRDSKLRMKMLRMVTLSMADRLLRDSLKGHSEMPVGALHATGWA